MGIDFHWIKLEKIKEMNDVLSEIYPDIRNDVFSDFTISTTDINSGSFFWRHGVDPFGGTHLRWNREIGSWKIFWNWLTKHKGCRFFAPQSKNRPSGVTFWKSFEAKIFWSGVGLRQLRSKMTKIFRAKS